VDLRSMAAVEHAGFSLALLDEPIPEDEHRME
jgi:hypothetical protein